MNVITREQKHRRTRLLSLIRHELNAYAIAATPFDTDATLNNLDYVLDTLRNGVDLSKLSPEAEAAFVKKEFGRRIFK